MPHPHQHDENLFTMRPSDCVKDDRIIGDFAGQLSPISDGAAWLDFVQLTCDEMNLGEIVREGGHQQCRHAQPQAALPLMWRVAQMVRTDREFAVGRRVALAWYAYARESLGARVELVSTFDSESTWVRIDYQDHFCFLSPTGRAYFESGELDLAAMRANGYSAGDLAARVDERLAHRSAPSPANRMADIARRAGLPVPPEDMQETLPAGMSGYRDDDTLIIGVQRGDRQDHVDTALAYGLAHLQNRDLHLILPAGTEQPTCRRAAFLAPRIRIWIHDGYRITAAPLPARDEIFAAVGQESWQVDLDARNTIRDRKVGQTMAERVELGWQWLGHITHTTATGRQHVDLARGNGPMLRVVVDASDPGDMTVLQAIDRWIWATANLGEIRSSLAGVPESEEVMLTFVVGSPDGVPAVKPWTDVLLEMIDPRCCVPS